MPLDRTQVCLEGIVGSQAYGLATPDSDEDRLGIFIANTADIVGLSHIADTHAEHAPDKTYHEVGKFIRLALAANPTVLELLYLDEYTSIDNWGTRLVVSAKRFLSNRVRKTYGGYAMSQLEDLMRRGDFGSDLKKRYAKHARHCMRLLHQGEQLIQTGTLKVRLDDPDYYHWVGTLPPEKLAHQFYIADARFKATESVLPDEPDTEWANDLLIQVRKAFF